MLIAHYIGDHSKDALPIRIGWGLTRLVQKGPYSHVTHCEAILHSFGRGKADIASSSIRDKGVRIKRDVQLNPPSWLITNVPQCDAARAEQWFIEHDGEPYDWRGAIATVMPGHIGKGRFCNEAVGESAGLLTPQCFTPSQFYAICLSFGSDVTTEFFNT